MIRRILHISALALGLVLAGCTAIREDIQSGDSLEIKFTAQVGTFQVKATDTGLELGDQVGLFAYEPVSANNVKMTWDGTSLVPEKRLFWTPGDERKVEFRAYYPYDPERTNEGSEFCVNADQSTHALFTASDYMVATTASKSSDGVVTFNFRHCFSKIVIHVDNQLQDLQITDIYLSNVRGRVEGEVSEYYNTIGLPGTIKTCKATTPEGEPVWAVIIPAQTCLPQLMITTADGKQFTYQSSSNVWFGRSFSCNAYVTLKENDIYTDFTSEVTEWTDNSDLEFPAITGKPWSLIGTIMGTNWDTDFPLDMVSKEFYYGVFRYNEGEEFKLRMDNDWKVDFGTNTDEAVQESIFLKMGGKNIKLPSSGNYELFFYPESNYVYITKAGTNRTWSIVGDVTGDWSIDDYMSCGNMNIDGIYYPVFHIYSEYRSGMEFKFRFQGNWQVNYSASADYLDPDIYYSVERDGPNNIIDGPDGYYHFAFDWVHKRMFVSKTGDVQYASGIEDVIDGRDGDFFYVKGYVTDIESTDYGNFYIANTADSDETLYIYGMKNTWGDYPMNSSGWYSEDFGLVPGDFVQVKGYKTTYKEVPELKDVRLVSVERVPIGLLSDTGTVGYMGGEYQFFFRCDEWPEISTESYWFNYYWGDCGKGWYCLTVYADENTGGDRKAAIRITSGNAVATVTFCQEGAVTTEHAGTLEDPYSVADITSLILGGNTPQDDVYIKGKVSAILYTFSASYGTGTFWISDDGVAYGVASNKKSTTDPEHDFECYSIYWLNNQPWAEGNTQIAVGDEVIVCGKTTIYNGTAETSSKNAWIYSLNGVTE